MTIEYQSISENWGDGAGTLDDFQRLAEYFGDIDEGHPVIETAIYAGCSCLIDTSDDPFFPIAVAIDDLDTWNSP